MSTPNGVSVEVIKPGGLSAYPSVIHEGVHYVCAIPGQPFEVRVKPSPAQLLASETVQVFLTLDGACPGYSHFCTAMHAQRVFEGFASSVKSEFRHKQFVFGDAQTGTGLPPGIGAPAATGTIVAKFYASAQTEALYLPVAPTNNAAAGGLKEGMNQNRQSKENNQEQGI